MNKGIALILGVVVFLAGVAAARMFQSESASTTNGRVVRMETPTLPVREERVPDLSADLARVHAELAELKKTIEPLQETDQKLRPLLASQAEAAPVQAPVSANADGPAGVADLLGLDSGRQIAFTRAFEETLRKIRSTEERHATAKKDGKITTITVAPFPDEGKALAREWSQELDGLLSSQEREKYRKYSMEHALFPQGLGQLGAEERTITITRTGGSVSVNESASNGHGGNWMKSASGGENVLDPYRHLLNAAGGR